MHLSPFLDYELIMEDILPNRTTGASWTTGGLENQEPALFEERHLIFLQLLGKVITLDDDKVMQASLRLHHKIVSVKLNCP